ncbi:MAG: two-component system, NtrC family, sensor kinase [Solirubrobacteraceae bacterium]
MSAALALLAVAFVTLVVVHCLRLVHKARAMAAALKASQLRYQQLVEQIPGVLYVVELGEGDEPSRPVYVSPRIEEIVGLRVSEWMSGLDRMLALVHPDDQPRVVDAIRMLREGRVPTTTEFRVVRFDGEVISLRDSRAVVVQDGDRLLLQGLLFDVTASARAEADRDRMELDLRLAQKLEAVGQLAAGIAHEINTPTQFVGDTVRFLGDAFGDVMELLAVYEELLAAAERGPVPSALIARVRKAEDRADLDYLRARVPGAVERADDGVHRVATIVRAMSDFAHPPAAAKAPVDVNGALRSTLVVASNEYKYVADVVTDFGELPPVMCDGGDMNQVFLNLVVNAAHAIVDANRGSARRGTIGVRTVAEGDEVLVSVSDTGTGIAPEVADRIYDPFFTTTEVGRGTGQGLAIARQIVVERHGGTITFETQAGRGTTFHVRLPVAESALGVGEMAA